MVLLRLLVLMFLAWWSWELGHIPNANAFGNFMGLMFFVLGPALYFLPSIEAALRKSEKGLPIGMLNLLLGWTLLGWVAAYIWALNSATEGSRQIQPPQPFQPPASSPAAAAPSSECECPHCAEIIKKAAKVCKHCGRDVSPSVEPNDPEEATARALGIYFEADRYVFQGSYFKKRTDAIAFAERNGRT